MMEICPETLLRLKHSQKVELFRQGIWQHGILFIFRVSYEAEVDLLLC